MTEFFAFSLREALAQEFDGEPNLAAFLSLWDTDNNQVLDSDEFDKVTTSLGFSSITKELMEMCETEPDGRSIKIAKITEALKQKSEDEAAKPFFEVASQIAQRPVEVVSGKGRKIMESDRPLSREKKKTRGPTSGKDYSQLFPEMDGETSFAITMSLSKIDQNAQKNVFYDPTLADTQKKEDVGQALSILRSWMRRKGLRALEVFQSWDKGGDLTITRRDLGDALAQYALNLSPELVTLIFDHMSEGYKLGYDDFKEWYESTKFEVLSDEEREARAA